MNLSEKWREEAESMRRRGIVGYPDVLESCAAELEADTRERALEALTLDQAVEESGYSYSALQKKLASGELDNVGSKGSPRVRRADLPKKAQKQAGPDLATTILRKKRLA